MNNTNKELLKSFIIGSSIPAFIILFLVVIYLFKTKQANFNYYRYSILAPIGIGIVSMLSKLISIKYNIKLKKSYFIFSLLSASFVSINISRGKSAYKFKTKHRWYLQYLLIFIGHLFIYNQIIYPLDIYLRL